MIWMIVLILFLSVWPVWLFVKLARYGQGIFHPNFERMKRKIDEWTHFSYDGFFAYNRLGGKALYYFLLLYVLAAVSFILYNFSK